MEVELRLWPEYRIPARNPARPLPALADEMALVEGADDRFVAVPDMLPEKEAQFV